VGHFGKIDHEKLLKLVEVGIEYVVPALAAP
jgi:hypothetical protein